MHQIGVVGLSYRHAGVDEVARFSVPRAEVLPRLAALRARLKAAEVLYVGTCNRIEVVFATDEGAAAGDARHEVFRGLAGREPDAGEAARLMRAWTGEAAVEHLFLLAGVAVPVYFVGYWVRRRRGLVLAHEDLERSPPRARRPCACQLPGYNPAPCLPRGRCASRATGAWRRTRSTRSTTTRRGRARSARGRGASRLRSAR